MAAPSTRSLLAGLGLVARARHPVRMVCRPALAQHYTTPPPYSLSSTPVTFRQRPERRARRADSDTKPPKPELVSLSPFTTRKRAPDYDYCPVCLVSGRKFTVGKKKYHGKQTTWFRCSSCRPHEYWEWGPWVNLRMLPISIDVPSYPHCFCKKPSERAVREDGVAILRCAEENKCAFERVGHSVVEHEWQEAARLTRQALEKDSITKTAEFETYDFKSWPLLLFPIKVKRAYTSQGVRLHRLLLRELAPPKSDWPEMMAEISEEHKKTVWFKSWRRFATGGSIGEYDFEAGKYPLIPGQTVMAAWDVEAEEGGKQRKVRRERVPRKRRKGAE